MNENIIKKYVPAEGLFHFTAQASISGKKKVSFKSETSEHTFKRIPKPCEHFHWHKYITSTVLPTGNRENCITRNY